MWNLYKLVYTLNHKLKEMGLKLTTYKIKVRSILKFNYTILLTIVLS